MADDRRRLWRLPDEDIQKLRSFYVDNGFGEMVSVLDSYAEIDTDKMKRIAADLYGTGETAAKRGIEDVDHRVTGTTGPNIAAELDGLAEDVKDQRNAHLEDYWEGEADQRFTSYISRLAAVTKVEGKRLMLMGEQVDNVAQQIERNIEDAEITLIGAAGLVSSVVGGGTGGGGGPASIALTACGTFLQLMSELEADAERRAAEKKVAAEAKLDIEAWANTGVAPSRLMPEFPSDAKDWEALD